MKKIHVHTVLDIYSLMACLHSIKEKSEPIIIIDSILALYLSFIGFNKNDGNIIILHILHILCILFIPFLYRFMLYESYLFNSKVLMQKKCNDINY